MIYKLIGGGVGMGGLGSCVISQQPFVVVAAAVVDADAVVQAETYRVHLGVDHQGGVVVATKMTKLYKLPYTAQLRTRLNKIHSANHQDFLGLDCYIQDVRRSLAHLLSC